MLSLPSLLAMLLLQPAPALSTPTAPPLQIAQADDAQIEAQQLLREGNAQFEQGDVNGAIASWQQALERYQQLGDLLGEAKALGNLGFAANAIGAYDQATSLYRAALGFARDLGNAELELSFLANLGLAHSALEQFELAIGAYEEALPLAQAQGNRTGEGAIAGALALAHEQLGGYERALELYQVMLTVANEQGDAETAAAATVGIERVEMALSPQSSRPPVEEPGDDPASQSDETSSETSDEAISNEAIGDSLQQQLQTARAAQDKSAEALTLLELGGWYRDQERLGEAIAAYEESLAIAETLEAPVLVEQGLLNLAALYQVVGQFERSRNAAQQLLTVAEEQGDPASQITALQNLGGVHFATGDMAAAIAAYEESLTLIEALGSPVNEAVTLALLAEAHLGLRDSATALTLLDEALALAEAQQNLELAGVLLGSIGKAHAIGGDYALAIEALQQNLASEQASQSPLGEALAQNNLGTAFFLAGELDSAQTHLQQAIALWEAQREQVGGSDPLQVTAFETQQQAYQTLQQVLIAQGETDAALLVSERGRTQALAGLLARRTSPETGANLVGDGLTISEIQQVAQSLGVTLVEYAITYDPDALFITGNVGQSPEADLFIWVVSPTGEIQFRQTPIPASIATLVSDARAALGVPRGRGLAVEQQLPQPDSDPPLQALQRLLIEPIQDLLPDDPNQPVVFIPQRELFLVPFAALTKGDRYLVQDHTLLTAPSIRVLDQLQATAPQPSAFPQSALVVGNPTPLSPIPGPAGPIELPPLPGAEREAEAIAAEIFETQALVGPAATKAAVVEALPSAQLIHLAAHGLLEYGDPRETGVRDVPGAIALAPDAPEESPEEAPEEAPETSLLTAADLLSLDLQATLAVLSACDTGRGDIRGDGVIGLSRSLMAAGVPSVLVSLWAVPDAPTEALMLEFYRQWQGGASKAQALRGAMLTLIEQGQSPAGWAGFTLVGRE